MALAVLSDHLGPAQWGRSDCVTLAEDYYVAFRDAPPSADRLRLLTPEGLRRDGRPRSQARVTALARERGQGKLWRGWRAVLMGHPGWGADGRPGLRCIYDPQGSRPADPRHEWPEALPGRMAVDAAGRLLVAGPDCAWWHRTEWGLEPGTDPPLVAFEVVPSCQG